MNSSQTADGKIAAEGIRKFYRRDGLTMRKLLEYVPVMIVTNLSLFLINTVDKIVAGNFIGKDAMNSISIFYPVLLLTAVFSGPVASGIATSLSKAMGQKDMAALAHIKSAAIQVTLVVAVVIGIIQIPAILMIIDSYGLSAELSSMVRQYAIGSMICTPISIVSTVGTYELQTAGKMRVVMVLTIIEGVCNIAFDLLFVAVFKMGVAGAGYGTACSNLVRCAATIFYTAKYTDFYKGDGKRATLQDFASIFSYGLPDAALILMMAFQNYATLRIILRSFGEDGGVIYGLCAFCLSIINVFLFGIQGGMRPLMGLFFGAEDIRGQRTLMRLGALHVIFYAGIVSAVIILFPAFFYRIHNVTDIPEGGLLSVQLYATAFVLRGFDYVFRLYFTNRKDIAFATGLTILGNATLPLFAWILAASGAPAPFIFLSYLFTELLIFGLSLFRYLYWISVDRKESREDISLYMTVKRDEAVEASRYLRRFADEHGIDKRISYRVALCMEEMVAFIKDSDTISLIPRDTPEVDIIVRFENAHSATFISLDDSAFIDLDKDDTKQKLITDNYSLIKKIAKEVEYQYILNMNYTRIRY